MRKKPIAMTVGDLKRVLANYDDSLIPVIMREGNGHCNFLTEDSFEEMDGPYYPGDMPKNDGPSLLIGTV